MNEVARSIPQGRHSHRPSPSLMSRCYDRVARDRLGDLRELAEALGAEPREVRSCLDQLQRDGLVRCVGSRWLATVAKPEPTPELAIPPLRTQEVEDASKVGRDDRGEPEPMAALEAPGPEVGRNGVEEVAVVEPDVLPPAGRAASDPTEIVEDPEPPAAPARPEERPSGPVAQSSPGAGLTPAYGQRVVEAREIRGWNQKALATQIGQRLGRVPTSVQALLSQVERGRVAAPEWLRDALDAILFAPDSTGEPTGRPTGAHPEGPSSVAPDERAGDEPATTLGGGVVSGDGGVGPGGQPGSGLGDEVPNGLTIDSAPAEGGVSLVPSADVGSQPECFIEDWQVPRTDTSRCPACPDGVIDDPSTEWMCGACQLSAPPHGETPFPSTPNNALTDNSAETEQGTESPYPVIEEGALGRIPGELGGPGFHRSPDGCPHDDIVDGDCMRCGEWSDMSLDPNPIVAERESDRWRSAVAGLVERVAALEQGLADGWFRGRRYATEATDPGHDTMLVRIYKLEGAVACIHRDAKPATPPDTSAELAAYREREAICRWLHSQRGPLENPKELASAIAGGEHLVGGR